MRRITLLASILGFAIPLLATASAQAQTRSWVSGVGDDLNPCSRTAPCKTFAGAISKTSTGGEINCLDPNGAGAVTITKSISIVCDYTEGGVLASGINGIVVNAPAGSIVTLKGLDIECFGTGINGIEMINVGVTLHIHKVQVRNCRGANGNGILVANSSNTAKVLVADSYITDNGAGGSNAGLLIKPTAGAFANVSVNRVQFEANTNAIFMDGSGGGGASNLTVKDSVLSASSSNGIAVSSTGAGFKAIVQSSSLAFNASAGATAAGAGATLLLGGNTIQGNVTGVLNSGATLQSFKNNQIGLNGTDGTPIPAFTSGGFTLN
jgi:hypothetical protein